MISIQQLDDHTVYSNIFIPIMMIMMLILMFLVVLWLCHDYVINIWVYYNDLSATSPEIMVSKGNHAQMALIQVGWILV